MKLAKQIFQLLLVSFIFLACGEQNNQQEEKKYIRAIDFSLYKEELMAARNLEESQRLDRSIFMEIETASLNKYLPKIHGFDRNRKKIAIDSLITSPTMLVLYSPFSGWNSMDLAREMPEVLKGVENPPAVICLLLEERNPSAKPLPENFYQIQQEQLSYLYPNFYLITSAEAQKLNMYALPSRYYFDGKGKLIQLEKGKASVERVIQEIKDFQQKLSSIPS